MDTVARLHYYHYTHSARPEGEGVAAALTFCLHTRGVALSRTRHLRGRASRSQAPPVATMTAPRDLKYIFRPAPSPHQAMGTARSDASLASHPWHRLLDAHRKCSARWTCELCSDRL